MFWTVAAVCIVLFLLYKWSVRERDYWERQSVPHLRAAFPFGNIAQTLLMRKTTGEAFKDIYEDNHFIKILAGVPGVTQEFAISDTIFIQPFRYILYSDIRIDVTTTEWGKRLYRSSFICLPRSMFLTFCSPYDRTRMQNVFPEEPIVGFFKLNRPALMLRDPEIIKNVLIKEFTRFPDNDFRVSVRVDPMVALNPFASQGPGWKILRAIQIPNQTVTKIKSMVPIMNEVSKSMLEYLEQQNSRYIECKEILGYYSMDTVAACAFGLDWNSFFDSKTGFRRLSDDALFRSNVLDNLAILCAINFPYILRIWRRRIISKKVQDFFVDMCKSAVHRRLSSSEKINDYIQHLIDSERLEKYDKIPEYRFIEMAGHCMTFFLDGYETSTLCLVFTLYELAKQQDVQDKLRREILDAGDSPSEFDYEKIKSLSYLDMVLAESLRLHPPIQQLTRVCSLDTALSYSGRECRILKGTTLVIPVYALHMDKRYYPNPEHFNPERFAKENKSSIPNFSYLPFGGGPRICTGLVFAQMQVKIALIAILSEFRVYAKDRGDKPLEIEPMSTFLRTPKGGMWLKFVKTDLRSRPQNQTEEE